MCFGLSRQCGFHSKVSQVFEVSHDGASHRFEFMVWQVAFGGGLLDDIGNFSVMDMADVREQMVLDLMVQSAGKPVDDFVFRRKVGRRIKLMDCPGVFDFAIFVGNGIRRFIYNVRQLEHDAQNQSCGVMHDEKSDKYFPPGYADNDWQYNPNRDIN
jgi:hypothetical protein